MRKSKITVSVLVLGALALAGCSSPGSGDAVEPSPSTFVTSEAPTDTTGGAAATVDYQVDPGVDLTEEQLASLEVFSAEAFEFLLSGPEAIVYPGKPINTEAQLAELEPYLDDSLIEIMRSEYSLLDPVGIADADLGAPNIVQVLTGITGIDGWHMYVGGNRAYFASKNPVEVTFDKVEDPAVISPCTGDVATLGKPCVLVERDFQQVKRYAEGKAFLTTSLHVGHTYVFDKGRWLIWTAWLDPTGGEIVYTGFDAF